MALRRCACVCAATVIAASPVLAQVGGHPTIAPPVNNSVVAGRESPLLNQANNQWDLGEAFPKDVGGILGQIPEPKTNLPPHVPLVGGGDPTGWHPATPQVPSWGTRYIGKMDPTGVTSTASEASFEIVAPATFRSGASGTVVILATQSTRGTDNTNERVIVNDPTPRHDKLDSLYFIVDRTWEGLADTGISRPARKVPSAFTNTMEVHDHVMTRPGLRTAPAPQPLLAQAPAATFRRFGAGTWLGAADSMKVAVAGGYEDRASVYVGSAEGIVTRFKVVDQPVPNSYPLVEQARSNRNGAEYALGYGAWAMDVGDIDNDTTLEVVVATYRRVTVLDAITLAFEQEVDAPFGIADDAWLYTRPLKLQIAECNSSNTGAEILLCTQYGRLFVLNKNLNVIAMHSESGIRDLVVGPASSPPQSPTFERPVYILSSRGHVARLELNSLVPPPADSGLLSAVSIPQYGGFWDLESVTYNGQPRIAALYTNHPPSERSIRLFDPNNLNLLQQFAKVQAPVIPPDPNQEWATKDLGIPVAGADPCMTTAVAGGVTYVVVLLKDHIELYNLNTAADYYLGFKDLSGFAPAKDACSVGAGNLDPNTPGDEVVISTLDGHVVWFKMSELLGALSPISVARSVVTSGNDVYDHRTNTTLAGTWALSYKPSTGGGRGRASCTRSGLMARGGPSIRAPAYRRTCANEPSRVELWCMAATK